MKRKTRSAVVEHKIGAVPVVSSDTRGVVGL